MVENLLEAIGEIAFGRGRSSPRAELIARLCFGLLGTALALAGAARFAFRPGPGDSATRASTVALFMCLACFSFFNVALARHWRWPGVLFVLSFGALFATRIIGGS